MATGEWRHVTPVQDSSDYNWIRLHRIILRTHWSGAVGALLLKSQKFQTKFSTHSMLFTFCCQKQLEGRKRTQLHNYNAKWPHIWKQREQCRHWEKLQQLVMPQELFWRGYFLLLISNLRGGAWCCLNSFKNWICWTPWPDLLNTRTFMSSSIYNVLKCQFWHYFKTSQQ